MDWRREVIERREAAGVYMADEITDRPDQVLEGLTMVVTSPLEDSTRDNTKEVIIPRGGKTVRLISEKTDYVVVSENAGSKVTKAEELDLPVFDEGEFKQLLETDQA